MSAATAQRMLLLAALGLAGACDSSSSAVEPVWHKQPCDHCHMVLSDPRYAAQLVTDDGQRLHFDDVGCLAELMLDRKYAGAHAWVHDASGWRDVHGARFASGAQTPMDYGFVSAPAGPYDFSAVMHAVAERNAKGAPP